jgi:hypothetical protein
MNHQLLLEQSKIKAELSFDILKESKEFKSLDESFQTFFKECYDDGVSYGGQTLVLSEQYLAEGKDIDEGFFDRVKAGVARTGQAIKNVTGIGTQTTDSKDAGIASRFKSFQNKFEPLIRRPPAAPNDPNAIVKAGNDALNRIDDKTKKDSSPTPTPEQAVDIVNRTQAPKGLKDKILNAIRQNPGKVKFLIGALAFGAGVAAAAYSLGNPLAAKAAGAIVNGIGNAALAKIQGRGTGDALMAGAGGALAGGALAGAGFNATNMLGAFAEKGVESVHNMLGGGVQAQFPNKPNVNLPTGGTSTGGAYPIKGTSPYDYSAANSGTGGAYPIKGTSPYDYSAANSGTGVQTQSFPGTRETDIIAGSANDPNQGFIQQQQAIQGFNQPVTQNVEIPQQIPQQIPQIQARSADLANLAEPKWTRTARAALDVKGGQRLTGRYEENVNLFNQTSKNNFKLNKLNKEELLEAKQLEPDQLSLLNDFLDDLAKMLNQPGAGSEDGRANVITFMQSQGTRFKDILEYLNKYDLVGSSGSSEGAKPAPVTPTAPEQQQAAPGQVSPEIVKLINTIKSNPLFAEDLTTKIVSIVDVKSDDQAAVNSLKEFLKLINQTIASQSVNIRKKVGDPSAILSTLKENAPAAANVKSQFVKQINSVMPTIITLTFQLRQLLSNKNPNAQQQGKPVVNNPTDTVKTIGEAVGGPLTQQQVGVIKAFLSQLVNVGVAVKNINPAQMDDAKLKNLFRTLLILASVITNKNIKGVKVNAKIDKAFQGKDLVGPGGDKESNKVKKGPGDMFKSDQKKSDSDDRSPMDYKGGNPDQRTSDKDNPELEEGKLFESINRKNKNIFKKK